MCPFCLATAAIIAGGATGTSGLAAVVVSKFRKKEFPAATGAKEERYGHEPDGSASPESGVARRVD